MKKIGKKNIGLLIIIILFGIYSVPKIIDRLSNENVIDTNRLHQKEQLSFLKIDGKDISKLSPQDRVKQGISFVPQT